MRSGELTTRYELRLGRNRLLEAVFATYDEAEEYYQLLKRELAVFAEKHIVPVTYDPKTEDEDFV